MQGLTALTNSPVPSRFCRWLPFGVVVCSQGSLAISGGQVGRRWARPCFGHSHAEQHQQVRWLYIKVCKDLIRWRDSQVVRQSPAKRLFVGSIPTPRPPHGTAQPTGLIIRGIVIRHSERAFPDGASSGRSAGVPPAWAPVDLGEAGAAWRMDTDAAI